MCRFTLCSGLLLLSCFSGVSHASNISILESPRIEPHGVESIGYPQICIRVNTKAQRTDVNGIFSDLSSQHGPLNLYSEAIKLAGSGILGHVWTIFFDSRDSWRTWSFRVQGGPGSDALNFNNFYENPSRAFNYQRCVSARGIDIDNDSIVQHYVKPLVEESRRTAALINSTPEFLPDGAGVYTPLTPCVWFATKLFNMVTKQKIPFEQPFEWAKVGAFLNEEGYSRFNSIVDAGVVAEALSRKVKFVIDFGFRTYLYTHDEKYISFDEYDSYMGSIESNIFIGPDFEKYYKDVKTVAVDGNNIYLLDYDGLISLFDLVSKRFVYRKVPFTRGFDNGGASVNQKDIVSVIPFHESMPFFDSNIKKFLLLTASGKVYHAIPSTSTVREVSDFQLIAPKLNKYIGIISGMSFHGGLMHLYLNNGSFIVVDPSNFDIVQGETEMKNHPVVGKYFILQ